MPGEALSERRDEWWNHVWDHTKDPFQAEFDLRRPLADEEIVPLVRISQEICRGKDDATVAKSLLKELQNESELILIVLQVTGLTRNKIITDLRASSAASKTQIPGRPQGLPRSKEAWNLAGPYIASRLRKVVEPLCGRGRKGGPPPEALEAINQATWPGWIRQQRAKLQGHEAEFRLATILAALEIPFEPEAKADNPLCPDAQVKGISFDLVVPGVQKPAVCLKSTVQTANIGQFGESKGALEVLEAVNALKGGRGRRPIVLALVDGIGFRSNTAGLDGILSNADEFCQFATLWKAAVVAAAAVKKKIVIALPKGHEKSHAPFLKRYGTAFTIVELNEKFRGKNPDELVEAGEALIRP